MKKVLSIVLITALSLTLIFGLVGCGEESGNIGESKSPSVSNSSTSGTENTDKNESVFPVALKDVQAIEIPDIELTGWTLSGGMVDGVEMEEADVKGILDACGGVFQFIFMPAKAIQMVNGEKSFEGAYKVTEDNFAFQATFTGYEYYGVFSKVEDVTVLIMANAKDPETALYFTMIDEH